MRILIVRNNSNSQAMDAALLLATYLATQGIDYTLVESADFNYRCDHAPLNEALKAGVDMAVVFGGDGTILRTARQVSEAQVPILGINFGRLGFLANSSEDGVVNIVAAALAGEVVEDRRANLRVDAVCEGEPDPWADDDDTLAHAASSRFEESQASRLYPERGESSENAESPAALANTYRTFFALNELAVTRGVSGRVIDFSFGVSGAHVAEMRGDGLVVATATGSTAYALSAGGPLVTPTFNGLVVVPLAPHTLLSRAIVTAGNDVVEIDLSNNADPSSLALLVDGELLEFDRPVKRIYVRRGSASTVLLRSQSEGFYQHAAEVFFSTKVD